MLRIIIFCVLLIASQAIVFAQTTPSDPKVLLGVGAAYTPFTPHVGMWSNACYGSTTNAYICAAEDVVGKVTSTRVGLEKVQFRKPPFYFTLKGDTGLSTGTHTLGGSYGAGGSLIYDTSGEKQKFVVFSVSWLKNNVAITNLRSFGSELTFRLGFMLAK